MKKIVYFITLSIVLLSGESCVQHCPNYDYKVLYDRIDDNNYTTGKKYVAHAGFGGSEALTKCTKYIENWDGSYQYGSHGDSINYGYSNTSYSCTRVKRTHEPYGGEPSENWCGYKKYEERNESIFTCYYCTNPSDRIPVPPEDTNTTHWKLIGEISCKDKDASLPNICTDSIHTANIRIQRWKTGCCGENIRCYQSVPKCDANQTLDTSFDPPICVDDAPTCDQNDTAFPPLKTHESVIFAPWTLPSDLPALCSQRKGVQQQQRVSCVSNYRCMCPYTPYTKEIAENETIFFTWYENSPIDKSALCKALHGTVDHERANCVTQYRCVGKTDACPAEENQNISSYVSPRDQSFHEDIPLDGVSFDLHYDSAEWNSTEVAHGWSVSAHAKLVGDRVHYGSGVVRVVDTSMVENNLTIIKSGSNEMLFDANGTLQSIRDLYTKETKTTFGYDNVGKLVTVTDIYGEISTIERDGNGTVTAIIAPTGQRTLLSIDDNSDLIEVQYEDSSSYAFEYERHLMTVETEPKGNRFLHFFDDAGNVVKVIDAEQAQWLFSSNTADSYGSHTVTRASGDVIVYKNHFLENNTTLRTEKLLPTGDVIEYSNSIDDSMSSTKSCGMTTTNLYKTNPDGSLFKDVYTAKRVLESSTVVTPSGLTNTTLFTKAYTLKQDGTLKRIVNTSTTNTTTSTHIKNFKRHRDISISALGKRSHVQYDTKMQNILQSKSYGLHKTLYTYNNEGKVIQETIGNRTTTYTYDAKGNLATTTDPLQHTTSYTYDSRDRLIQTTYADGSVELFDYDANSNPIKRTVPTPADHTFSYNGVNKRTGYTSPEQKQTTYTYDKQRRVIQVTKPSSKTINTTYTNGRVTSIQTEEGTTDYSYACQSNVSQISKGSEKFTFTYDGTLLTSISQTGQVNQTIDYTYNNDLLPTSMTYAGQTENYIYNDDNEPTQIGTYTITRKQKNRKIILSDGNYRQVTKLNRYGELRKQKDNAIRIRLFRNKLGQIVKKVEKLQGQRKKVYHYTYDERGRLTEVKERRHIIESYTYDSNGNRQSATVNNQPLTASYTLDDNLVVYGDNTYLYDEDGYLTEKTTPQGTTTYRYGTLGELLEVTTPTKTITYTHNANNQRVAKLVDGTVVEKYLWADLTTLLATYDANDNLKQRFEYADQRMPVAMTDANNTKYYLHYDQVGSLRAISRVLSPDNTLELIKEITYDTFGNILTDTNPTLSVPFGFAGGLYDSDTKLTRFGYRDYDAYTGKWTAKDPIGFAGGDSNLYGYVLGDPVNFVDPMGLMTKKIINKATEVTIKKAFCEAQNTKNTNNCIKVQEKLWNEAGVYDYKDLVGSLFIKCMSGSIDCGCKQ